ncbi:hypothetical protein SKAU_G00186120 [Synaphobranchus kaupii]|uniref:Uncharacterized protein n=1 Tax=Synaphobranchus kaupii TaxID=118154 RepID=A0A9Q1FCI1_SYNKA|nr:hypothetical protein SKAU_G00186120 [Synaphobranchus kaupii]
MAPHPRRVTVPLQLCVEMRYKDGRRAVTKLDCRVRLSTSRLSIAHGLRLTSAYGHQMKEGGKPEVTTCHSRTALTVDYIFYSAARGDALQPECSVAPEQGLQLLARLALVDERDVWTASGLPNERNSSDHLPLLTRFRLCH